MDSDIVLTKIVNGSYDTKTNLFVIAYDNIFRWTISKYRDAVLSVNIYSIDFILIWNDDINILELSLHDNIFTAYVNEKILPRYGFSLMLLLKDTHECSIILSKYLIKDINKIILSYLL